MDKLAWHVSVGGHLVPSVLRNMPACMDCKHEIRDLQCPCFGDYSTPVPEPSVFTIELKKDIGEPPPCVNKNGPPDWFYRKD